MWTNGGASRLLLVGFVRGEGSQFDQRFEDAVPCRRAAWLLIWAQCAWGPNQPPADGPAPGKLEPSDVGQVRFGWSPEVVPRDCCFLGGETSWAVV